MADDTKYNWPAAPERTLIGKRMSRVDGPVKSSGRAKYTYDVHRPGMLYGKVVRCPYAHAKVTSVDTTAAEKMPGVVAVHVIQEPGKEIHWAGDDIVVVAAVDEGAAEDAAKVVKVEYEPLPHFVDDFTEPKNVPEDRGPIDQEDFITMLRNDVPDPQIVSAIQSRGITFKPSAGLLQRLRENEVGESVISAVQSAQVKPAKKSRERHIARKRRRPRVIPTRDSSRRKWSPKACTAVR
jgi:hypothetical protein